MTRDEIIAIIRHSTPCAHAVAADIADRILALLPPREPTPAMVEAMWKAVYQRSIAGQMDKQEAIAFARAAWAAGYAKGEER